jgi:hypothetical protein
MSPPVNADVGKFKETMTRSLQEIAIRYLTGILLLVLLGIIYSLVFDDRNPNIPGDKTAKQLNSITHEIVDTLLISGMILTVIFTVRPPSDKLTKWAS